MYDIIYIYKYIYIFMYIIIYIIYIHSVLHSVRAVFAYAARQLAPRMYKAPSTSMSDFESGMKQHRAL